MNNMNQPENKNPESLRAEIISKYEASLDRAVLAVSGEVGTSINDVFPNPRSEERRADVAFDDSVVYDEEAFRAAMAEMGPGRVENRGAKEVGLQEGYVALVEAGQAHKIVAELNVIFNKDEIAPSAVIIAASSERILPEQERIVTAGVLGIDQDSVGRTEYDISRQSLLSQPGFEQAEDEILPYSYDSEGALVPGEDSQQFVKVGSLNGADVVLMRIDREYNEDGSYSQLDNIAKMNVISDILSEQGNDSTEIGFATSATYEPSNVVSSFHSQSETSRPTKVISYGTQELAGVKGGEPTLPALNQLAGEAYKVAQQIDSLRNQQ